jgi:Tfp pilus assembly protein FimT
MSGVTIVELLVALAVAGILFGSRDAEFRDFVERNRSAVLNQLIGALQTRGTQQSHCTPRRCVPVRRRRLRSTRQLAGGSTVFADRNANGQPIQARTSCVRFRRCRPVRVYWRSFRNRSFLQIKATGLTNWQNGHLLYCPNSASLRASRHRRCARTCHNATDRDRDGVVEDANGDPLTCPSAASTQRQVPGTLLN